MHVQAGINTALSVLLVLFSIYILEILGRGNQPQAGVGNPCAPHHLNKSL